MFRPSSVGSPTIGQSPLTSNTRGTVAMIRGDTEFTLVQSVNHGAGQLFSIFQRLRIQILKVQHEMLSQRAIVVLILVFLFVIVLFGTRGLSGLNPRSSIRTIDLHVDGLHSFRHGWNRQVGKDRFICYYYRRRLHRGGRGLGQVSQSKGQSKGNNQRHMKDSGRDLDLVGRRFGCFSRTHYAVVKSIYLCVLSMGSSTS
mmetsp:Transcript_33505/g.81151  ORF Transcript_33505/g.81151 Transcript_33505/m.81151 type:complete len:200 (+) Transcript_33505:2806-3405(+)